MTVIETFAGPVCSGCWACLVDGPCLCGNLDDPGLTPEADQDTMASAQNAPSSFAMMLAGMILIAGVVSFVIWLSITTAGTVPPFGADSAVIATGVSSRG